MSKDILNKDDNNNIKLSVAIPTYNGVRYIQETLDSIVSQLGEISEEVEILVSDNASTDETSEIIGEYQRKYSFIKYFCNDENLGADRNFDLAVRRSSGEYVWLFSDDDIMVPGAIKKAISVLRNYPKLAAIFVNWGNYNPNLKKHHIKRNVNIQKDMLFITADDFLSTVKLNAIFVSSNIICRSLWEQVHSELYIESNWIHYAILLNFIVGHRSYCIAEPYVMYRAGNIRWDKCSEESIKNTIALMKILNSLIGKGYSKKSITKAARVIIHHLPVEIIRYKRKGLILRQLHIRNMIIQFKSYPSFWFIDLPLLLLPNQIYKSNVIKLIYTISKKVYKKLKGVRS